MQAMNTRRAPGPAILTAHNVNKAFGATLALRDFDFSLAHGEIHALLGENGAGKSTFIKVLAGIHIPDTGTITHRDLDATTPAGRRGIAFIHQDLGLVDSLTVAENVALVTGYLGRGGIANWRRIRATTRDCLARVGASLDPDQLVADLSPADRAVLAIARALSTDVDVLVLDEPTASLPAGEVRRLFAVLDTLRAAQAGIIYVSHRLAEVLEIADRVTVMRDGRREATVDARDVSERDLGGMIIGHDVGAHDARRPPVEAAARAMLDAVGLTSRNLRPLDLHIREGEVLGCTGLKGAGHEDIGRIVFGLAGAAGSVRVGGRELSRRTPEEALRAKVTYVVGDRKQGLSATLTVTENLYLNPDTALVNPARERQRGAEVLRKYRVRPPEPEWQIQQLSGGNAQKVAVARALEARPRVLILDEPTAGIDVGAREELYALIDGTLQAGTCVLVVSTDYDEIVRLCDRVLVFERGRVKATLGRGEITRDALAATAMGAA
jgi:ribose transport system ATP-binding protein